MKDGPVNHGAGTWSRRAFLGGSAAWWCGAAHGAKPLRAVRTVSILHTTDLHGHIRPTMTYEGIGGVGGLARCATQIRAWRKENPHSLLVDVGDVWQGTEVGHATRGLLMTRLFARLGYDAWVPGNHDFDWGREVFERAVAGSLMPVLGANLRIEGAKQGEGPWSKWLPWIVKEVGGFRIGLVGLTTPGLPDWLAPETLGGIAALDPAAALRESLRAMKEQKPDAIVVLGHMGWRFQDDFANPVREVLRQAPGVDVYLAGHSHQDQPSWSLHGVLCSQANYHGIHCGRVDLAFDADSRKLINRRAFTVLMDGRFDEDPVVLREAGEDLDRADRELARKVAVVSNPITGKGRDSGLVRLFCEAFAAALGRAGENIDGVFHGSFGSGDIGPGPVTVADCWTWIPYENLLVVADLSAEQLAAIVAEDAKDSKSDRTLWPFEVEFDKQGKLRRFAREGQEITDLTRRFRIAFNSYDTQSAGRRLPRLRDLVAAPEARRRLTAIDTRGALVEHLLEKRGL